MRTADVFLSEEHTAFCFISIDYIFSFNQHIGIIGIIPVELKDNCNWLMVGSNDL